MRAWFNADEFRNNCEKRLRPIYDWLNTAGHVGDFHVQGKLELRELSRDWLSLPVDRQKIAFWIIQSLGRPIPYPDLFVARDIRIRVVRFPGAPLARYGSRDLIIVYKAIRRQLTRLLTRRSHRVSIGARAAVNADEKTSIQHDQAVSVEAFSRWRHTFEREPEAAYWVRGGRKLEKRDRFAGCLQVPLRKGKWEPKVRLEIIAELILAYFYALCDAVSFARVSAARFIALAGECPPHERWDRDVRDSLLQESAYRSEIPTLRELDDDRASWCELWKNGYDPALSTVLFTYSRYCIDLGDERTAG